MKVAGLRQKIGELGRPLIATEFPELAFYDWVPAVYQWFKRYKGYQLRAGLFKTGDVRQALQRVPREYLARPRLPDGLIALNPIPPEVVWDCPAARAGQSLRVSRLACLRCGASGAILEPDTVTAMQRYGVRVPCPYCGAGMTIVQDPSLKAAVAAQAASANAHLAPARPERLRTTSSARVSA